MSTTCDILALGPHPDDIELGAAGLLINASARGQSICLVDLTKGELASQGSIEDREKEASVAAKILGAKKRIQLGLADGGIYARDEKQLDAVVKTIRQEKPSLVLAPYWESRHPDHSASADLVIRACFFAALENYKQELGKRHQIVQLAHYALRRTFEPNFIVDVSEHYEKKLAAINCYHSQVNRSKDREFEAHDPGPLISSSLAIESLKSRDGFYGAQIGVKYAEGYKTRNAIRIDNPLEHFCSSPTTAALMQDIAW